MPKNYTPQEVLALPMGDNDAKATTIGQYLIRLSQQCWLEEEGFSGKRPFGNSGWSHDIDKALIRANAVNGCLDEFDYIDDIDSPAAVAIIKEAYSFLLNADYTTLQLPPAPKDWIVVAIDPEDSIVSSHISEMMDEGTAFATAAERNKGVTLWVWHAIRVPK